MSKTLAFSLFAIAALAAAPAEAAVRITEFLQTGAGGANREYFELTNIGSSAVDINGWSFNDNNPNAPVLFSTLGVGSIGANESIVFTEMTAAAFRTFWALPDSVRIFSYGGNSNLSSDGDQINIYNSSTQNASTLADGITFGAGTNGTSKNRPVGGDGNVDGSLYVLSAPGDGFGSHVAAGGADIGNPGSYPALAAAVPEPAAWAMMIAGFDLVGGGLRRRRFETSAKLGVARASYR